MKRNKNIFSKIGSLIPGYTGYAERDGRRNCDKALREGIVIKLIEVEKILYEKMNEALKQKNKDHIRDIEEVRKQINTFISKVKFAPHGATSFFNDNQIKEDELLNIYQVDLDLAESVGYLYNNLDTSTLLEKKEMLKASQKILIKRNTFINEFKG